MLVIGIVGGVASGKSLVAGQFERLGALSLDADAAAHRVLREPAVIQAIRERWGDGVLDGEGQVVRSRVASIVFGPPPEGPIELAFLEQLTHPRIGAILQQQIESARQQGKSAVVLDAAVMCKAGWDRLCDRVLFVEADAAERERRARSRGWSDNERRVREAAQTPLSEKLALATDVVVNSGTSEQTRQQIEQLWQDWKLDSN